MVTPNDPTLVASSKPCSIFGTADKACFNTYNFSLQSILKFLHCPLQITHSTSFTKTQKSTVPSMTYN